MVIKITREDIGKFIPNEFVLSSSGMTDAVHRTPPFTDEVHSCSKAKFAAVWRLRNPTSIASSSGI